MHEIKSVKEFNEKVILQSDKLVVVDFFANWCNPCKKLMPFLEDEIEDKLLEQGVKLYKCKAYTDSVADKKKINLGELFVHDVVPCLAFFKNRELVAVLHGTEECKEKVLETVKQYI